MDKVIGNYIKEYRSLIIISLCVIYYIYNKYKEDIESVNKELKRNFHYLVSIWWNKDDTDSTLIEVPNIRNRYNIPSNLQASANFIA